MAALVQVEPQRVPHPRCSFFDVARQTRAAHERKGILARGTREVAVPLLALLADVDGVEQVRARAFDALVAGGAEVGDRNALDRRLLKKQEADRCVRGPGEAL